MSGRSATSEVSLVAVGLGIRVVGQLTTEAIAWIRRADRVLYIVADPIAEVTLRQLNPAGCESLLRFYRDGRHRRETYEDMAERALWSVRSGDLTCIASYGHPGYYADPIHLAIRLAREEGFGTLMLPAVSAEDCLFADLGVDPATTGCQSYDATDFLIYHRKIDISAGVVLWQVGLVGDPLYRTGGYDQSLIPLLVARLLELYPSEHVAYVYQASMLPGTPPSILPSEIGLLEGVKFGSMSTLYIPPAEEPVPDQAVLDQIRALGSPTRPTARSSPAGLAGDRASGA